MKEKTTEELKTLIRRDFKADRLRMRMAAVEVVEGKCGKPAEKYKYYSGRVDALASFAACAFSISLHTECEENL